MYFLTDFSVDSGVSCVVDGRLYNLVVFEASLNPTKLNEYSIICWKIFVKTLTLNVGGKVRGYFTIKTT